MESLTGFRCDDDVEPIDVYERSAWLVGVIVVVGTEKDAMDLKQVGGEVGADATGDRIVAYLRRGSASA